jgi:hypothetical protein
VKKKFIFASCARNDRFGAFFEKNTLGPLGLKGMILQMEWNECVRFGEHVDIEVSYKILWLDVLTPKIPQNPKWVGRT